jgi:hypothetical protein
MCQDRNRLLPRAAVAASALCIALGGVAGARPLTLTITPAAPTWQDSLHLRVEGVAQTSCGAGVMRLVNLRRSAQGVDVDLVQDGCDSQTPPVATPFSVDVALGRMEGRAFGTFAANVHDLADGGLATAQFKVYGLGRVDLDAPALAVSGEPIEIGVTARESCFYVDRDVVVTGNVIELIYDFGCNLEGYPPAVDRRAVHVGPLAAGDYEVRAFWTFGKFAVNRLPLRVWDAAGCVPADERLCLRHGRFQVSARWRTFDGTTGSAHAAPLDGDEGSGLLWFFAPDNTELTVKVIEGCPVNQRWWAFVASSSTVEYEVTVTDTRSGATRTYTNALGQVPELLADTGAFPCP